MKDPEETANEPGKITLLRKPIVHILLIVVAGLFAYFNTLHVPFQFDDYNFIVDNHKLRAISNLWPPSGSRWTGFLTFALNYEFGGLNVIGYHIFNLAIHIINALLVYWLVLLTLKLQDARCKFQDSKKAISSEQLAVSNKLTANRYPLTAGISELLTPNSLLALFSALIFVSHPVQTQAVTYIVQRFTSLATLFYLLSLVLYVKFRMHTPLYPPLIRGELKGGENSNLLILNPLFWYLGSVFSAVLAMKTKEIAFTLPVIIVLYEFCFFTKTFNLPKNRQAGFKLSTCQRTGRQALNFKIFIFLVPFLLTLVIIPLNFIGHEWEMHKPAPDTEEKLRQLQLRDLAVLSKYDYLLTQFRVIVTYIRLLFLPINQNVDYDYPVYNSFLNPNVFLSFLFLLSVFGLAVYLFYCSRQHPLYEPLASYGSCPTGHRPSRRPQSPLAKGGIEGGLTPNSLPIMHHGLRITAFGIFWFFITLSVESSVIPIEDVIFEHRLYLPGIGLIIAFVSAMFYFFPRITNYGLRLPAGEAGITVLLLTTFVVMLSIASFQRNAVWKDELSLWGDAAKKSPDKARVFNNLGFWGHYKKGRVDEAINAYKTALMIDPNYANAYLNLGVAYFSRGETDKAIQALLTSLRLKPGYLEAHKNLIGIYYKQGMYDEAIEEIRTTQLLRKNEDAETYTNLGALYIKKNLPDKAIEYLNHALTINPHYAPAYNNLSIAYELKGQKEKADEYLKKAYSSGLDKYPKSFN